MTKLPRPPVVLDPAVADPEAVWALVEAHQPYWPVQRYFGTAAEYAALSGNRAEDMVVAPTFRGHWAADGVPLDGVDPDVRVKVATGVAWFYAGCDGGFEYWPDGPDAPSVIHEGDIDNTMIVGDNDFMWHRVRPTGRVEDGMPSLSLDAELVADGEGGWAIVDGGRTVATFPRERVRVSVSWKADVFDSDEDLARFEDRSDDIDIDVVLARFVDDLRGRGVDVRVPDGDPSRDPEFIALLQREYVRYPSEVVTG